MTRDVHTVARIDLRGFTPKPDALLETLEHIAAIGYQGFALLYDDLFPWTLDERIRSSAAYPEDVVAGIEEWCRRRELTHCIDISAYGLTDPLISCEAFGHLREVLERTASADRFNGIAANMVERVVEDVLSLVPTTGLLFSASSVFPVPGIPMALKRRIETTYENYLDSPSPWGILLPADDSGWGPVDLIPHPSGAMLYQPVEIACVTTSRSFGGLPIRPLPDLLPRYADLLRNRRDSTSGPGAKRRQDTFAESEFETVIEIQHAAGEAVYTAEQSLIIWQHGQQIRKGAALVAVENAAQQAFAAVTALQSALEGFTTRESDIVEDGPLALHSASVLAPLHERIAVLEARLRASRRLNP